MARARNIKPGLFKNEILGVADPLYTILFEGLWVLADRDGKLEDRPLRIKGEVFPYRDVDTDPMLDWLQQQGFIRRYAVAGKRYILIIEFVKHQSPHKNETESVIPNPEEIGASTENIGSARADCLNLIPDSLNPHTDSAGPTACGRMARVLREKGVNVTPSHPLLVAWVQKGVTPELALEAVQLARVNKPPPEAIPPKYLDAVIAGLLTPAGSKTAAAQVKPWFIQSASAIEAKGRELGLDPDAMPFPDFRLLVFKKAGVTEAQLRAAEKEYR